ncbi:alcohol dehydrogenase catalytic domain-containing protein [Gluconobacter cerinus]|nr:alcohol dehydrogenase catalytic domain-containing protein [Gluconobacter cerinus]
MVRGRTTAPSGLVLGHEITGEVIETGSDVEMVHKGDLVSVPFNVACGRCRCCREQQHGRMPDSQCKPLGWRLWLCGYGRMDRRTGPLRHGSLCRFQSAALP